MSINNIRAVGDDRQWKDEVERELKSLLDIIKYGKISLRVASTATGGGGGSTSPGADAISAVLPATYDNTTYVVGVDQDSFDHISSLDYLEFDTTSATPSDIGVMVWNDVDGTLNFGLKGGNVTLQVGQEHLIHAKNSTGSTIPDVTAVMFDGAAGGKVRVTPAVSTALSEPYAFVGITTEAIADGEIGFVTQFGMINDIDTSMWADGSLLYVDPTTPGALTSTVPIAPNWTFPVAAVIKSNSTTGKILVRAVPGAHVHDLVDARIGTLADNNLFAWDSTDSVWKNQTAAEASLLTTSATLDSLADVVITTPATDQVVKYDGTNWVNAASPGGGGGTVTSITAGTGLSASPSSPITTSGTLSLNASLDNLSDVAITSPAEGQTLLYDGSGFVNTAPPSYNYVINGAFDIWQRGETAAYTYGATIYAADRWRVGRTASVAGGNTSRSTTVPTGFDYSTFLQRVSGNTATNGLILSQVFESAGVALRGKTVTLSFYARPGNNYSATDNLLEFGFNSASVAPESVGYATGGLFLSSNPGIASGSESVALSTDWERYSGTFTIPEDADAFMIYFRFNPTGTAGANDFVRIAGVQLEEGSIATPFHRNTTNIQAELAACQRYYYRITADVVNSRFGNGHNAQATVGSILTFFPVTMRTRPTALEQTGTAANYEVQHGNTAAVCNAVPSFVTANRTNAITNLAVASGLTAGQGCNGRFATSTAFLGWSAEL